MARLNVAFSEGKETVGAFVLDAITPMVSGFVNKVVPAVQKLSEELGPKLTPVFQFLTGYIKDTVLPTFKNIFAFIQDFVIPAVRDFLTPVINGLRAAFEKVTGKIKENEEKFKPLVAFFEVAAEFIRDTLAPVLGKVLGGAFKVLGEAIGFVIDLFATLIDSINKAFNAIKAIINFIKNNPVSKFIGGAFDTVFGGGKAMGGPVNAGTSYVVGERGPELFMPNQSGTIIPNNKLGSSGTVINLTVNGAIDGESTARQIVRILNDSQARGTLGAAAFG
jgi:hypothetical protein